MTERKKASSAKRKPTTVPVAWRRLAEEQAEQLKAYRSGLDRIADAMFPLIKPDFTDVPVGFAVGAILTQLDFERRADQQRSMIETLSQRACAADKRVTELERRLGSRERLYVYALGAGDSLAFELRIKPDEMLTNRAGLVAVPHARGGFEIVKNKWGEPGQHARDLAELLDMTRGVARG